MPPGLALIKPMLATPGAVTDPRFADGDWAYEMKWDGVRAVVYLDGVRTRIFSRNDRDVSVSYPEFRPLAAVLGERDVVLDGEIVAIDAAGRPSFGRLQQRMHVADPGTAARLASTVPAVLLAFDVLRLDGVSQLDRPYEQRRATLDRLGLSESYVQTPPAFDSSATDAMQASEAAGLEGIVAKRSGSRYRSGARSPDWIKIKHVRMQEVVIGGWRPGRGRRADSVGSLLMGVHDDDGLHYIGHVGTGFSDAVLRQLSTQLGALRVADSPFHTTLPREVSRDAHWVRPDLVGEVAYSEWTGDDRLRHPTWRGLRPDKAAVEVVRES